MADFSDKRMEQIVDQVYEWGAEFSKSDYFAELTEEQKNNSEGIVMNFADYMYSYLGLAPREWDTGSVEECCVEVLPRKVTADDEYFEAVSPVLSAFFYYLGNQEILPNALKLAVLVRRLHKDIVDAAKNPANWGMAKSFAMGAIEAGVDPSSERDMQEYINDYNASALSGGLPLGLDGLIPGLGKPVSKKSSGKRKLSRKERKKRKADRKRGRGKK